MSCGNGTRRRPDSTPTKQLPCYSTSGGWTPTYPPASVADLRAALDQQLHQLETRVEELRGVLRSNRCRSIKDYWRGRVPDLQLRSTAIRGAINVVNYAPSGLWSVRVQESEKVLLEASDVIGEVQRYWEALHAKRPMNLPAFERLVWAHIPRRVPEEWRSVQDYTLQDLKDALRQAMADDKAPGSNRVTAALIGELPEPVQGLLVHAYRAILWGADVPESWHEAIFWLMPKATATGNLDEYRPIALGQQDMRMLMTPLMQSFTAVVARKLLAADWQFGAMPGSKAAARVPGPTQAAAWARTKPRPGLRCVKSFCHSATRGAGAPPAPHGSPGRAHLALPHPQLQVPGAHRHCARPDAEHSAPQGPAAGQCGERCALPPPLRTSPAEPCLQGAGRCSPCGANPRAGVL